MTGLNWKLLETLNLWQHSLEGLLRDLHGSDGPSTLWIADQVEGDIPNVQVQETPSEVVLKAYLPQVSVDEINVQVSAETVLLQIVQQPPAHIRADYFNDEFFPHRCQSLIPMPQMVQPHVAIAQFQDHVLTLTLLKSAQARQSVSVEIVELEHTSTSNPSSNRETIAMSATTTSNALK